jgi:outer membrane autotransporter protein
VNVGQFLAVMGTAGLHVLENSTLDVNVNDGALSPSGEGMVLVGQYGGDFPDFKDPVKDSPYPDTTADPSYTPGGELKIYAGSRVNVSGRFYLGAAGTVDVAPGAVLDVDGDFYWKKDGVYEVGASGSDVGLINASGKAFISEGAVVSFPSSLITAQGQVIFTAGSYADGVLPLSAFNKILKSGNGLVIGPVDSALAVGVISGSGSGPGASANTGSMASLLDRAVMSSNTPQGLKDALTAYVNHALVLAESKSPLADVSLRQAAGEEALASAGMAAIAIRSLNTALAGRLGFIHSWRQAAPSAGNSGFLNRLWASGFGSWARQKDVNGLYGFDFNVGGVLLGYDRRLDSAPGLTLGVDLGWSSGTLKNNDRLSSIKSTTISVGAYGSYVAANGLFLDADLGFGFSGNDFSSSQAVGGRKTANFDSRSFQAGLGFGYIAGISPNFSLTPQIGLRRVHIRLKGWTESIASNPNSLVIANWFGGSKADFLEIPLSLKLEGSFETSGGVVFTPEFRIGAVVVADKPSCEVRVGFAGSGESAVMRAIDSGKSRFAAGAGFKIQAGDHLDLHASYDLEASSSFRSHSAQLGVGFSF